MFGSLNTDTMTGKGLFLLYVFILILMVYLWIRLITKKREVEKGTAILIFVLCAATLASLIKGVLASPIDRLVVIENAALLVVFSVIGATEVIFYRKQNSSQDKDGSE